MFLAKEHHDRWIRSYDDAGLSASDKLLSIVDSHFHRQICTPKKLAVWYAFYGEAGRRAIYRDLVDEIDDQRFDTATALCQQIIEEGGYKGIPASQVSNTLEALYDGISLNILMYPNKFSRHQAKDQIRCYIASVFPNHFEMPAFPADQDCNNCTA